MTTIILVAIGIILAAVAALMVIFYGGDAFGNSQVRADAARLVTEGTQIEYATDLYYRQGGRLPGNGTDGEAAIQELLDSDYLSHVPLGVRAASGNAPWRMAYGNDGMIYSRLGPQTDASSMAVCREARRQLGFTDKIESGPDEGKLNVYKCDGTDYIDSRWRTSGTIPEREPCCIR